MAAKGRAGFYEGEVAEDMITSLQALGGGHTLEDLAATRCSYGKPVSGDYKGHTLLEHPPNGQGATAILLLKILKHFDLAAMDPFGTQRAHIEAEASKLAYDARNRFIAEASPRLDHMLSDETAARLAALIDPKRAMAAAAPLTEAMHRDTIYITVVDRDRMAVSLIYSIFWGFGSGLASRKFGINFQNRGAGFTLAQGHPNEMAGGKRPMHTIIPAMLAKGGRIVMPFGVMGGAYQPCGHARFVTNMVDYRDGPADGCGRSALFQRAGLACWWNAAIPTRCGPNWRRWGMRSSVPARTVGRRAEHRDRRQRRSDRGLGPAQGRLCAGILKWRGIERWTIPKSRPASAP